jgi:hypothetical protein
VDALVNALYEPEADVRERVAEALGRFEGAGPGDALIKTLNDPNAAVRRTAAFALGRMKYSQAIEPLIGMLTKDDLEVAGYAADALSKIGDTSGRAGIALREIVQKGDLNRIAYMYDAVIILGDPKSIDILKTLLLVRGYKTMAEAYLNSGSSSLAVAAKAWADTHGYEIEPARPGEHTGVSWGSWGQPH